MKIFASLLMILLPTIIFAHELEVREVTNLSEAQWQGAIIAFIIIVVSILIASKIRKNFKEEP